MKQLENFIKLLRDSGYPTISEWQKKIDNGYILCARIYKTNGKNVIVLFHVYGNHGFGMYIESKGMSISESFKDIENSLK